MCADHLRSLLMTTPRTLAQETNSNSVPSMAIWEKQGGVPLKHVRTSLHLIWFSWRRFSWDQPWMKWAACCRVLCFEGGTTSETVVSSVNFHLWNPSGRRKSFIIARNSHGPKRVPWGTAAGTSNQSESTPFQDRKTCQCYRARKDIYNTAETVVSIAILKILVCFTHPNFV